MGDQEINFSSNFRRGEIINKDNPNEAVIEQSSMDLDSKSNKQDQSQDERKLFIDSLIIFASIIYAYSLIFLIPKFKICLQVLLWSACVLSILNLILEIVRIIRFLK